jgi:NADH dehydrogenase
MDRVRTVGVAGATGFVGSAIVEELLARGHEVRALARDRAKASAVLPRHERLRVVQGDALDPGAVRELVVGALACVNAIGIIREAGSETFRKVHVETPRLLTHAAREAGLERFVHISALGASAEGRTAYQKTKFEGERIVERSGFSWTILRPSLIHGPRGEFIRMAKGWVTGKKPPWLFLPYFTRGVPISDAPLAALRREAAAVAPVAVEDVAWAAAESLERDQAIGEIFNLCGPETLRWPELLLAIRDAVPAAEPHLEPMGIPADFAAVQARVATALGLGGLLPFDEGMAIMGATDSVSERDKARQLLDFEPRPFRRTLRGYAAAIA